MKLERLVKNICTHKKKKNESRDWTRRRKEHEDNRASNVYKNKYLLLEQNKSMLFSIVDNDKDEEDNGDNDANEINK